MAPICRAIRKGRATPKSSVVRVSAPVLGDPAQRQPTCRVYRAIAVVGLAARGHDAQAAQHVRKRVSTCLQLGPVSRISRASNSPGIGLAVSTVDAWRPAAA